MSWSGQAGRRFAGSGVHPGPPSRPWPRPACSPDEAWLPPRTSPIGQQCRCVDHTGPATPSPPAVTPRPPGWATRPLALARLKGRRSQRRRPLPSRPFGGSGGNRAERPGGAAWAGRGADAEERLGRRVGGAAAPAAEAGSTLEAVRGRTGRTASGARVVQSGCPGRQAAGTPGCGVSRGKGRTGAAHSRGARAGIRQSGG